MALGATRRLPVHIAHSFTPMGVAAVAQKASDGGSSAPSRAVTVAELLARNPPAASGPNRWTAARAIPVGHCSGAEGGRRREPNGSPAPPAVRAAAGDGSPHRVRRTAVAAGTLLAAGSVLGMVALIDTSGDRGTRDAVRPVLTPRPGELGRPVDGRSPRPVRPPSSGVAAQSGGHRPRRAAGFGVDLHRLPGDGGRVGGWRRRRRRLGRRPRERRRSSAGRERSAGARSRRAAAGAGRERPAAADRARTGGSTGPGGSGSGWNGRRERQRKRRCDRRRRILRRRGERFGRRGRAGRQLRRLDVDLDLDGTAGSDDDPSSSGSSSGGAVAPARGSGALGDRRDRTPRRRRRGRGPGRYRIRRARARPRPGRRGRRRRRRMLDDGGRHR